jgi:hypothetical protein
MSSIAHSTTEEYFSGQGVVLIGLRTADGKPKGLRPVGNCPALAIKNATSVLEHKESTTGARGTDKRLTTEIKVTLSATLENFNSKNLADAIRGAVTQVAGSSVTGETFYAYAGLVSPLEHIQVSAYTLKMGATNTLTAYTNDSSTWDYKINEESGSVLFNDGSDQAFANLGVVPTAIAVGATTTYTVPSGHNFAVGDSAVARGLTGADAGDVNSVSTTVTAVGATSVTVNINTTGDTITTAAGSRLVNTSGGMPATADYTWATQQEIDAFTSGAKELWMRFEGLNTAEDDSPVVVDIFKYLLDPTQELSLISDQLQQFVLEGSVLADTLQDTGSKYYKVKKIDK